MPNNDEIATLASTIKHGIDNRLKDLHTSMPGIIESFDPVTQLASIQPAIKRIFKTNDGDVEFLTPVDLPILINVPIIFPRGGGFSLTFPVKKGNECLINFCERSIDNWHLTGKSKIPLAKRFHSLSDAVAIVGLSSLPNKIVDYNNTDVELKKDDGSAIFTIKDDGAIRQENDNGFVELQADGKFNINGVIFSEHVHTQANDSGGDTEANTGIPV